MDGWTTVALNQVCDVWCTYMQKNLYPQDGISKKRADGLLYAHKRQQETPSAFFMNIILRV